MIIFIDNQKLNEYQSNNDVSGIFISHVKKNDKWIVLNKNSNFSDVTEFNDVIEATKHIVELQKTLKIKKAFDRKLNLTI